MRAGVGALCLVLVAVAGACGDDGDPDSGRRDGSVPDTGSTDAGAADGSAPDGSMHPFGTHTPYHGTGVVFPSHPGSELDAATVAFYEQWKGEYVRPGCEEGQQRIRTSSATDAWSVSEGHGYGMLVAAMVAGHDPDARTIFDGLYRYYDAHRSTGDPDLMAWAQNGSCDNVMGPDSATDGDLDIAYALLLADVQWGSTGAIDYRSEAVRIIAAILRSEVHPAGYVLLGDWASEPADAYYTGTRTSDFAVHHFKTFGAATGVTRWSEVVDKTYQLIDALQTAFAPATGLLPDFAVDAPTATPRPAPGGWLEGPQDGDYSWNACRTPWRIATDFLMTGDERSRAAVRPINAWVRAETGDDPGAVRDGYHLDGGAVGSNPELAFLAPLAVSAMVEPESGTNQAWLDALWDEMVARPIGDYYNDSLKLLAMIVVSGNWWAP